MIPLPSVGVAPHAQVLGMGSFAEADSVQLLDCMPFEQMLDTEHETDAHFCCYTVMEPDGTLADSWPRLKKTIVRELHSLGGDVLQTMICLDYDNPDHEAWTEEHFDAFLLKMETARRGGYDIVDQATTVYTTRAGARFVFVLDQPLSAAKAKPYIRSLISEFKAAGITVDPLCDWGRLFRAPRVLRDGKRTSDNPYFWVEHRPDVRLRWRDLAPEGKPDQTAGSVVEIRTSRPDPGVAQSSLRDREGRETYWFKESRRRLRGRECYGPIYDGTEIADSGARDITIHRMVGQAVALLFDLEGTTPELIYALFLDPVMQLEPDEKTPDWLAVLWRAVCTWYSAEAGKAENQERLNKLRRLEALTVQQRMIEGVREWHASLPEDEDEAWDWISEHLIAASSIGKSFYIMKPDGYYDSMGVSEKLIVSRIRALGMESVIPTHEPRADGQGVKQIPTQKLLSMYTTIADTFEGRAGGPGTYIKSPDTSHSVMVRRMFGRRRDITPAFSTDVDNWLQALFGDEYGMGCEWIGQALAFEDGPICALSIAGRPGCGKKLLYQGLAECIETEIAADGKELGRFASLLLRTPFLVVNEGLPKLGDGAKHPADTFRALVGGDPIVLEQKFRDSMIVRSPIRMLFMANNTEVVKILSGGRDLSLDDRDAILQRLWHIDARETRATDWLRERGGLSFTGRPGNRWIAGDSGQPSDFIVARHFLWLHENRQPVKHGARLLVEGSYDTELLRLMTVSSGSAPAVIETLLQMIENRHPVPGLHVSKKGVFVVSQAVVDRYRKELHSVMRHDIRQETVAGVLKGIMPRGVSGAKDRTLTTAGGKLRARWWEIDLELLLSTAVEYGFPANRLVKLIGEQNQHQFSTSMGAS